MERDRWARLKEFFYLALERPAPERDAFLHEACGADEVLRAEVVALLDAHEASAGLLDAPFELPFELAQTQGAEGGDAEPARRGQRFGVWEIVRHLGAGGMGTVYLARRADGQFAQQAALKLVKRGMDSDVILRRFRAERQILAGLEHPNICRLLDGGVSDDGLPYFVMELIDGEPIDLYCRRLELSVPHRLELFVTICGAVHYAHQKLVVHRDIKPRNVLVTADGTPKLLDFGLAKWLGPDEDHHTRTEGRLMTLAYASPEQLRGDAVSTATDVHALGILLSELLVGQNPFTRDGRLSSDVARAIIEEEPPPPSHMVKDRRLARALRGDLDNITATALRKDAARRYVSAERLAADVLRHLRHEPVEARRDSLVYRGARFVRRHRLGVAALAAVVLSLGVSTLWTARQARLLARERDVAAAERDKARAVSEFVLQLFDADPLADTETQSDLVPLRDFLSRSEATVRRELVGQPELKASLLSLLTRLHGRLGKLDLARKLGDEALALREAAGDRGSADLAATLTALATVEQDQGDYALAEQHFRRALAIREALYGPQHKDVAEAVNNLAVFLNIVRRSGDAEGETLARRGLALRRALYGDDHTDTAQSLNTLASQLYYRRKPGDMEEAEALYRESIAIRARHLGEHHPNVAGTRSNRAAALRELGRYQESAALFRVAAADLSAAFGGEHPTLSAALFGLSKSLTALKDYDGAEEALRKAIAIDEKTLPADHPYRAEGAKALAELRRAAGRGP